MQRSLPAMMKNNSLYLRCPHCYTELTISAGKTNDPLLYKYQATCKNCKLKLESNTFHKKYLAKEDLVIKIQGLKGCS